MTSLADRLVRAEDSRFCSVSHLANWLRRLASIVLTRTLHSAAKCCCSSDSLAHHWSEDMNIKCIITEQKSYTGDTKEKLYGESLYKYTWKRERGKMEFIINKSADLCKSKLSILKMNKRSIPRSVIYQITNVPALTCFQKSSCWSSFHVSTSMAAAQRSCKRCL